jgi:hypothetical protein
VRDKISRVCGSTWERVRLIGKWVDPSGGMFRRVEAWTAKISLDLESKTFDLSFGKERGGAWRSDNNCGTSVEARAMPEGLRLHRSTDPRLRHHFWWFFWLRGVSMNR